MYHSITIGNKNTWDDWHLIPATRPLFNPPPVKTNYVEIPGADGVLDLTTVMTGKPLYNNRTGSWTFYVQNGFKDWATLYSEIMVYLHGSEYDAILEDDPMFYYTGRFSVNQWKSDPNWSTITIDYNVSPYKQYRIDNKFLWDAFEFPTGIVRYYKDHPVSGTFRLTVIGDMMETTPVIISSVSGMKVTFGGKTYSLNQGANMIKDIIVSEGENNFTFTGYGNISIQLVGGRL